MKTCSLHFLTVSFFFSQINWGGKMKGVFSIKPLLGSSISVGFISHILSPNTQNKLLFNVSILLTKKKLFCFVCFVVNTISVISWKHKKKCSQVNTIWTKECLVDFNKTHRANPDSKRLTAQQVLISVDIPVLYALIRKKTWIFSAV